MILNLREVSGFCDYFVIASAESTRKVKAIADAVIDALRKKGVRISHVEGVTEGVWVLLDFGDVVTHIFYQETREFYDLERLWRDAPKEHISDKWRKLLSKKKSPAS